jgi:hypothetical protein
MIDSESLSTYIMNVQRLAVNGRAFCTIDNLQLGLLLAVIGVSTKYKRVLIPEILSKREGDGSVESLQGATFLPVAIGTTTNFKFVGDIKFDKSTTLMKARLKLMETGVASVEVFPDSFEFITIPEFAGIPREKENIMPVSRCGGCLVRKIIALTLYSYSPIFEL